MSIQNILIFLIENQILQLKNDVEMCILAIKTIEKYKIKYKIHQNEHQVMVNLVQLISEKRPDIKIDQKQIESMLKSLIEFQKENKQSKCC